MKKLHGCTPETKPDRMTAAYSEGELIMNGKQKKYIRLILSVMLCFTSARMPVKAEEPEVTQIPDDTQETMTSQEIVTETAVPEENEEVQVTELQNEQETEEAVLPEADKTEVTADTESGTEESLQEENRFAVTFIIAGEDTKETRYVSDGDLLERPDSFEKDGYYLSDWYTSEEMTEETRWDFDHFAVSEDVVLYAKREPVTAEENSDAELQTLEPHVETIVFASGEISAYENDTVQLVWTVTPEGVPDPSVSFSSSDEGVASVDENGLVRCISPGTATISAVSADGGKTGTCTLTVERGAVRYLIHYELNGGINHEDNPDSYTADDTVVFCSPVRMGYSFLGWYKDPAFKKKITSIAQGSQGDITVYAKWKRDTNKITYKLNGGKNPKGAQASYHVESETFRLVMPTRKGYAFGGWYKDPEFTDRIISVETGSTGNLTLYAKWNIIHYGIAYALEEDAENNALNPSDYTVLDTVSFSAPSRSGYYFIGWYSDPQLKKKATTVKKGSTGEKILYPKWGINSFTVVFNGNGGTGKAPKQLKCKYNNSYMIPANTFKLKGGSFVSWNTKPDGSGEMYEEYQEVSNLVAENKGKLTLYAQWKYTDFEIEYVLNGGTNNENNPATYTINTPTFKLLEPVREGYEFKGWYSDPQFKTAFNSIVTGSIGDKTVYAKWEPKKYKITYMLDGGDKGDNPDTYTIESSFTFSEPQKTGFHSLGWFTDPEFTEPITKIEEGTTGDLTLYVKWEGNMYYIRFDANGGSGTVPETLYVRYDEQVKLPSTNLSYNGLLFGGWNLSKFGTHTNYMPGEYCSKLTPRNGNTVTLYANWKLETPVISSVKATKYNIMSISYNKVSLATEYEIVRSRTYGGSYLPDGTSTYGSYTSGNLTENTTYYYKVRAVYTDSAGKKFYSDYSSPVSGKTALKPKFTAHISHLTGQSTSTVSLYVTNNGTEDMIIELGNALFYPYSGATSTKMNIYGSGKTIFGAGGSYVSHLPLYNSRIPQADAYLFIAFEYDGCSYSATVGDKGVNVWR